MALKLVLTISILTLGLAFAWFYLLRPGHLRNDRLSAMFGDRPWRRLGAGIAAVVAVMFAVGAYLVDIPDRPGPYAVYWIVLMGMVVWLGFLAVKDVRHTRRVVRKWRAEERERRQRVQDISAKGRAP